MHIPRILIHRSAIILAAVAALTLTWSPVAARAATSVLTPPPSPFDFGNGDIHSGGGPSQTFTFMNNTPATTVTVTGDGLVGTDASQFSTSSDNCTGAGTPAVLAPGASCSVQVSFHPTSVGAKSASLELTDDTGTLDLPLSGTGITGVLTANPNPLTFTPQPYFNGSQQQGLNIQNSSDAGTLATSMTITGPDASRFYIAWGQNCASQQYGTNWSCGMGIGFNPPNGAGTFHAQLEVVSDSASTPLVVPLSATALNGPHAVITPVQTDFGNVPIGSSVARSVTIANNGDAPMQVQQAFMVAGSGVLPITQDGCSGQVINVGASCQFTVTFEPNAPGYRDGTVILISNGPGPVTPIGFSGTGVAPPNKTPAMSGNGSPGSTLTPPDGAAAISGNVASGGTLTCNPVGYPAGTTYAYQWLRNGRVVPGANSPSIAVLDTDIGAELACRIVATNSGGTRMASSPHTPRVAPLSLTRQPGAFTDEQICRSLQIVHSIRLGRRPVSVSYGQPATPWAPLTLGSPGPLKASIDGRSAGLARGAITFTPRTLSTFPDGSHIVSLTSGAHNAQARLLLGPCWLATRVDGGSGQTTTLSASSRYGMNSLTFRLPAGLRIKSNGGRRLGSVAFQSAGYPRRFFNLIGSRTSFNDVTVTITAHAIAVTNLPSQTGVISISLPPGAISGHPGQIGLTAREQGMRGVLRAGTSAKWLQ